MLRKYNNIIPVKLFLINTEPTETLKKLNLDIQIRQPKYDYFFLNRTLLQECTGKTLHIDADTLIYGDVEELFNYDAAFVASVDEWMMAECGIPIFNCGVTLWNGCQKAFATYLPNMCERLTTDEFPISQWLKKWGYYHREQVATSFFVAYLNHCTFDEKHVVHLFNKEALTKRPIIFHYFANNWCHFQDT